jgi:hypothetical protein
MREIIIGFLIWFLVVFVGIGLHIITNEDINKINIEKNINSSF